MRSKVKALLTPLIIPMICLLCVIGCVYRVFFWVPAAKWDASATRLVVRISTHCDYRQAIFEFPRVQIWGDGRVIWIEYNHYSQRFVFEGYLTHQQMATLIEILVKEIFKFEPLEDWSSYDCKYKEYVDLQLSGVYGHNLLSSLSREAIATALLNPGFESHEFVPTTGKLYALPIDRDLQWYRQHEIKVFFWPDDHFGYTLEDVYRTNPVYAWGPVKITGPGRDIVGEELQLAWSIVNSSIADPVMSNGKLYQITVRIPVIFP